MQCGEGRGIRSHELSNPDLPISEGKQWSCTWFHDMAIFFFLRFLGGAWINTVYLEKSKFTNACSLMLVFCFRDSDNFGM